MALVKQGNALLLKNGALATGQACCCDKCSGPCPAGVSECAPGCGCKDSQCVSCSGPCDAENPCPEGCVCVNGQCVAGGACCTCSSALQEWTFSYFDGPYDPAYGLVVFCDEQEAMVRRLALLDEASGRAASAASALSAAGWTCVSQSANVFSDMVSNWNGSFLENPECAPDAIVYRNASDFWAVGAVCCGTVDTEGEPVDLGDGLQAYPCVGPYVYDVCTDNVPAEQCCGIHHPGKTCAEEPCGDGCFERALLGDEAYVDGWCANAASSVGFAGSPCEFTTATCGARTLVNDYGGGFGDWIVTVCCDNPLP